MALDFPKDKTDIKLIVVILGWLVLVAPVSVLFGEVWQSVVWMLITAGLVYLSLIFILNVKRKK